MMCEKAKQERTKIEAKRLQNIDEKREIEELIITYKICPICGESLYVEYLYKHKFWTGDVLDRALYKCSNHGIVKDRDLNIPSSIDCC